MDYKTAENGMRAGGVIRRWAWGEGREAYYDIDGDGVPDALVPSYSLSRVAALKEYNDFVSKICIRTAGVVEVGTYITHGDTLAQDWIIVSPPFSIK